MNSVTELVYHRIAHKVTLTGPNNITDGAINFDGTANLTTTNLISNPQSFTIGIWFRTSAALGRKLIGLESSQIGGSGSPVAIRRTSSASSRGSGAVVNRPGFAGGSNFQIGWSRYEQDDEQILP